MNTPATTVAGTGSIVRFEPTRALQQANSLGPATDAVVWIDVVRGTGREWIGHLRRFAGGEVYDEHVHDAENEMHPAYYDATSNYEMLVIRALAEFEIARDDPGAPPRMRLRTAPVAFFIAPRLVLTVRPPQGDPFAAMRVRLLAAGQPGGLRSPRSAEELLLRLIDAIVDRYVEMRQPMADSLEHWQRQLINPGRPFRDWAALLEARNELQRLESICEQQSDALQKWRDDRADRDEQPDASPSEAIAAADFEHDRDGPPPALPAGAWLGPLDDRLQVRVNDLLEHLHRVLTQARRLETGIETAVQLHFSANANRTNEIMRVLTVLTAVFMPLTLITGVFGMNFDAMPLVKWPHGFGVTIAAMLLIAVLLLAWFRARRFLYETGFQRLRRRLRRVSRDDPSR